MTANELRRTLAAVSARTRQAVALTVPDPQAEARAEGLILAPALVTREQLIDACAVTAVAVYLATLEALGAALEIPEPPEPS